MTCLLNVTLTQLNSNFKGGTNNGGRSSRNSSIMIAIILKGLSTNLYFKSQKKYQYLNVFVKYNIYMARSV